MSMTVGTKVPVSVKVLSCLGSHPICKTRLPNVEKAAELGISAIIQPGGSQNDDEVIKRANELNIGLVFTGIRHFRH